MSCVLPLISVIVPVYNVEKYLPKCIESLLAQTYQNLEILLVNDGSTDSSGKICDKYAETDPRIQVFHKDNGGVSSARNLALECIRGEYVGFIDSDDTVSADMYEKLYLNLKDTDSDVSVCDRFYCYDQVADKESDAHTETFSTFSNEEALVEMYIGKNFYASTCNKLFKAEVIRDLRFDTDIYIGEDLLFASQALIKSKKVCFRSGQYYNYFQRGTSAMHSPPSYKSITHYHAHLKILDCLKENGMEHLSRYVDFLILILCIKLLRKAYCSENIEKQYCVFAKSTLKKHLNRESFALLPSSAKRKVPIITLSWRLYFLLFKILKK